MIIKNVVYFYKLFFKYNLKPFRMRTKLVTNLYYTKKYSIQK